MQPETRSSALYRFFTERPWAVELNTLGLMQSVMARWFAGDRLTAEELDAIRAAAPQRTTSSPKQSAIAVLPLWGMISPHAIGSLSSGPTTALDTWVNTFLELDNDPNIGTIVLDIDSPGGAVDLVPEVAAKIRNAKTETIAVANVRAASAAYWLAAQADTLIVSPSGAVGSIGVYAAHQDVSRQLEAEGVTTTLVSAGDHKVDGNPFEPLSDQAREKIQADVDAFYDMFQADVAKGRGVNVSTVNRTFGQGRMLLANDALAVGMVDGVASLADTLEKLVAGKPVTSSTRSRARALEPALAVDQAITYAGDGEIGFAHTAAGNASNSATILRRLTAADPSILTAAIAELEQLTGDTAAPDSGHAPASVGHAVTGGSTSTTTTPNKEKHPVDAFASIEELEDRRQAIAAEMSDLDQAASGRALNDEEQIAYDAFNAEIEQVDGAIANINQRRLDLARIARANPDNAIEANAGAAAAAHERTINIGIPRGPENVFDLGSYRKHASSIDELFALQRDGARRIVENLKFHGGDNPRVHEFLEERLAADEKGELARRVVLTGSPEYDKAFGKAVMRGRDSLTTHEDSVMKAAISESGLGSETPVPITIDPTVLLTSNGQTNPLRGVADVRTISGLTWRGITSGGITAAYESAEGNQVADGSPTFGGGDISVLRCDAYVPFSVEVDMDWPQLRSELAREFQDSKDVLEGTKYFTGSGTNEPTGLITAVTAATAQIVKTATTAVFAYTDPKTAANALATRWDAEAQWFAAKAVWSDLEDLLAAAGNADPFSFVGGMQGANEKVRVGGGNLGSTYRGYGMNAASAMDSAITTSGKNVMIIGDPRGYVIVDRIGMNIELIPTVFGANGRPTGQRGLFAYWRNNANVRTTGAFVVLQVK